MRRNCQRHSDPSPRCDRKRPRGRRAALRPWRLQYRSGGDRYSCSTRLMRLRPPAPDSPTCRYRPWISVVLGGSPCKAGRRPRHGPWTSDPGRAHPMAKSVPVHSFAFARRYAKNHEDPRRFSPVRTTCGVRRCPACQYPACVATTWGSKAVHLIPAGRKTGSSLSGRPAGILLILRAAA
jgi:hypothetical protein